MEHKNMLVEWFEERKGQLQEGDFVLVNGISETEAQDLHNYIIELGLKIHLICNYDFSFEPASELRNQGWEKFPEPESKVKDDDSFMKPKDFNITQAYPNGVPVVQKSLGISTTMYSGKTIWETTQREFLIRQHSFREGGLVTVAGEGIMVQALAQFIHELGFPDVTVCSHIESRTNVLLKNGWSQLGEFLTFEIKGEGNEHKDEG